MGSGCSLHKIQQMEIIDLKLKNDINNNITDLYPDRFKAIHRVILTLAEKNYVLNGYLFIDRPRREIKLIAQNDLGGIVFDVHFIKNVEKTIHVNVNTIKQKWIENSVLRDLEILYLTESLVSPTLFSDQHGNLILSQKDSQITQEFIYKQIHKPVQYRLKEIRHWKNGQCIYIVNFKYGTVSNNLYPEVILIKDTKMKYNLQINVRYFM
ncbi:MAG: hypothetical protein PF690_00070 [Deltaproteobacteria bacterium]|jgi:hypothetical protein|nr:hypothetical protein [Deltaproteobacteria bacterium]